MSKGYIKIPRKRRLYPSLIDEETNTAITAKRAAKKLNKTLRMKEGFKEAFTVKVECYRCGKATNLIVTKNSLKPYVEEYIEERLAALLKQNKKKLV